MVVVPSPSPTQQHRWPNHRRLPLSQSLAMVTDQERERRRSSFSFFFFFFPPQNIHRVPFFLPSLSSVINRRTTRMVARPSPDGGHLNVVAGRRPADERKEKKRWDREEDNLGSTTPDHQLSPKNPLRPPHNPVHPTAMNPGQPGGRRRQNLEERSRNRGTLFRILLR